jgi:hypothetical protein
MSVEHIFHCQGPDCERRVQTQKARPPVFVTVLENDGFGSEFESHFCGWDCILRYAGTKEPEEVVRLDD